MTPDEQRDAFLRMLAANPYDQLTRLVFSDWLDEQGEDEAAEWQRGWTPEWQKAHDWMHQFAADTGVPYHEVMAAASRFVETGEDFIAEDYTAAWSAFNAMWEDDTRAEFWRCWQILVGETVAPDRQRRVFECPC